MSSQLINGKHYKQVVIEYYDDLIARLDVNAEERMKQIKDDDEFSKYETTIINEREMKACDAEDNAERGFLGLGFFESIHKRFDCPSREDCFQPVYSKRHHGKFHDFVHCERMRGVNEMKKLQKDRLEEIKRAEKKPTTVEEALFGGEKFGFLIEIQENLAPMKFRLVVVVVDFFLENVHIEQVE
jgi:hypothetical protein